jgi:hypothetical protein
MKGELYLQNMLLFDQDLKQRYYNREDMGSSKLASYELGNPVIITHAIKEGDVLKISAAADGIRYEARFNYKATLKENGWYEISGGSFKGTGRFVEVTPMKLGKFAASFICISEPQTGGHALRWSFGINEVVLADDENTQGPEQSA